MYYFNGVPGFDEHGVDIFYFLFAFIFLLLLTNIPNDIIEVALPVIIIFTVVSNIALVYALVTDPTWSVGQRAVINYSSTETGERSGSPHDFARNALMSIIVCGSWIFRPQTGFLLRVVCLFFAVFGAAILVMTQTRSSVIALGLIIILFLAVNARPAQIRRTLRGLFRPMSLLTMAIFIGGLSVLLRRFGDVYGILYGYAVAFIERNLENVYAALGMRSAGVAYKATLDASAANRAVSTDFFSNVIIGHLEMLILGNGYKFLYLDIPLLEAFVNHGILGLLLFGSMNVVMLWQSFRAMQTNLNPLTTFLAYFYVLVFVQLLTNGRPYEIYHWLPLGLMIRFVGLESRFPVRLWNRPPVIVYEGYAMPMAASSQSQKTT